MRRIFPIALLGLLALAAPSWAGCLSCGLHSGCCPGCTPTPPPEQCDCGCPCGHRLHMNFFDRSSEYIATLQDCNSNCCERIKAAEKLGCRLHADYCCDPGIAEALIAALQCDPCWEVRKAAAWSLMLQRARTEDVVLALYVASRVDYYYMVRATAAEALDILTVCCKPCYVELLKAGDAIALELRARKYKAGMDNCCGVVAEAFSAGRLAYEKAAAAEAAKKAAQAVPIPVGPPVVVPVKPGTPVRQLPVTP
jgi:hypothetical protein